MVKAPTQPEVIAHTQVVRVVIPAVPKVLTQQEVLEQLLANQVKGGSSSQAMETSSPTRCC